MSAALETWRPAPAQVKIAGRLSYFVMSSEYASPARTETSLAISPLNLEIPHCARNDKVGCSPAMNLSYGGGFAGR